MASQSSVPAPRRARHADHVLAGAAGGGAPAPGWRGSGNRRWRPAPRCWRAGTRAPRGRTGTRAAPRSRPSGSRRGTRATISVRCGSMRATRSPRATPRPVRALASRSDSPCSSRKVRVRVSPVSSSQCSATRAGSAAQRRHVDVGDVEVLPEPASGTIRSARGNGRLPCASARARPRCPRRSRDLESRELHAELARHLRGREEAADAVAAVLGHGEVAPVHGLEGGDDVADAHLRHVEHRERLQASARAS